MPGQALETVEFVLAFVAIGGNVQHTGVAALDHEAVDLAIVHRDIRKQTIEAIAAGSATPGVNIFDATNDGIGISPEHEGSLITPDIQALIDEALQGMQDGTLVTCPENCGQP